MRALVIFVLFFSPGALAKTAQLQFSPEHTLAKVLELMKLKPQQIPLPEVRFASLVSLADFQNDVEPQWGFRPDQVTNVYIAAGNRIYLLDEESFYLEKDRCMDDSLAHELVHFIQVKYLKIPIEQFDDSMEWQAIEVQSQFRDLFCPKSPPKKSRH